MNEDTIQSESSVGNSALVESNGVVHSPELDALRDARKRAADARIAAENALIEAHAAEAKLIAEEERATAAAVVAKREQLSQAASAAAERERSALERVSNTAAQLQQSQRTCDEIQSESNVIAQALDEARRTLETLIASAAEQAKRLEQAAADERHFEAQHAEAQQHAREATSAREHAEAAVLFVLPAPQFETLKGTLEPDVPQTGIPSFLVTRAQRAAERRAADAARSTSGG
jgi:hypothetical protein